MFDANGNRKPIIEMTSECIIRKTDGRLLLIAAPQDGRHHAVNNLNAGKMLDKDLDMLADLPVFDEDTLTNPVVKILETDAFVARRY